MTMHRLSAGAGYQYLLKHTATGDCDRTGSSPLTAYYAESGNPPGRWLGSGLGAVDDGAGLAVGAMVSEPGMALAVVDRTALFTRTGTAGCEQRRAPGVLAAGFDYWDSRAAEPNLHIHR